MHERYTYYDTGGPTCYLPEDGLARVIAYDAPTYVAAIDRMAVGELIYSRRLTPEELAGSGLISEPREEEI